MGGYCGSSTPGWKVRAVPRRHVLGRWLEGSRAGGVMNFLYALDAETGRPVKGLAIMGEWICGRICGGICSQSIALTTPGVIYKT